MQNLLRALHVSGDSPKQGPTSEWLTWASLKAETAWSENYQLRVVKRPEDPEGRAAISRWGFC